MVKNNFLGFRKWIVVFEKLLGSTVFLISRFSHCSHFFLLLIFRYLRIAQWINNQVGSSQSNCVRPMRGGEEDRWVSE